MRNLPQGHGAPLDKTLVGLIPPSLRIGSLFHVTPDAELPFLHVYPPDGNTPFRLHQ